MASDLARVVPLRRRDRRAKEVVAVVLADGTVRRTDGDGGRDRSDWTSGQIAGNDWVLWWQRRSFDGR